MAPLPTASALLPSARDETLSGCDGDLSPDASAPALLAYQILPPIPAVVPPLSFRDPQPPLASSACIASRHHPPMVRHLLDSSHPLPSRKLASSLLAAFASPAAQPTFSACPEAPQLNLSGDAAARSPRARGKAQQKQAVAHAVGEEATAPARTDTVAESDDAGAKPRRSPEVSHACLSAAGASASRLSAGRLLGAPDAQPVPSYSPLRRFTESVAPSAAPSSSLFIAPFFSSPAAPQRSPTSLQSELASSALRCRAAELQQTRLLRALAAAVYRAVHPHARNLADIIETHGLAAAADLYAQGAVASETARLRQKDDSLESVIGAALTGHRSPLLEEASSPVTGASPFASPRPLLCGASGDAASSSRPSLLGARRGRREAFLVSSASIVAEGDRGGAAEGEGAVAWRFFRGSRGDVFDFLPVVVAAAGVDAGDHRLAVQLLTAECMSRSRRTWKKWRRRQLRLQRERANDTTDDEAAEGDAGGDEGRARPAQEPEEAREEEGVFFFRAAVLRASECNSVAAAMQSMYLQLTAPPVSFAGASSLRPRRDDAATTSLFAAASQSLEKAIHPLLRGARAREDVSTTVAWESAPSTLLGRAAGPASTQTQAASTLEHLLLAQLQTKREDRLQAAAAGGRKAGENGLFAAPFVLGDEADDGRGDDAEAAAAGGEGMLGTAKRFDGICEKLELWWRALELFPDAAHADAAEATCEKAATIRGARRGRGRGRLGDGLLGADEGALSVARTRRQKQVRALWDEGSDEEDEDADSGDEAARAKKSGSSQAARGAGSDARAPRKKSRAASVSSDSPSGAREACAAASPLAVGTCVFRPLSGSAAEASCLGEDLVARRRGGAPAVRVDSAALLVVLEETEAFSLSFVASFLHLLALLRTQCRLPLVVVTAASSSSSVRQFLSHPRTTCRLAVEAATLLQPSLVQQQIVTLLLSSAATLPFTLALPSLLVLLQHTEENATPSVLQLVHLFQLVIRMFYQTHPLAFLCRGFEDAVGLLHAEESEDGAEADARGGGKKAAHAAERKPRSSLERAGESDAAGEDGARIATASEAKATQSAEDAGTPEGEEAARSFHARASQVLKKWRRRMELLAFSSVTEDHIRLLTQLLRNTSEVYVHLVAAQQHGFLFFDRCCLQQEQLLQKNAALGGAVPRASPLARRSRPCDDEESDDESASENPPASSLWVEAAATSPLPVAASSLTSASPVFPSLPACLRAGGCACRRAVLAQLRAWCGSRAFLVFSKVQEGFKERRAALLERRRLARRPQENEAEEDEQLRRDEREAIAAVLCAEVLPQSLLDLAERRLGVALAFRLLLLLQQQLERQRRSGGPRAAEGGCRSLLALLATDTETASLRSGGGKADSRRSAARGSQAKAKAKPQRRAADEEESGESQTEADDRSDASSEDDGERDERDGGSGAGEVESGSRTMIDELERLLGVHEETACILRKYRPQQRIQEMARATRAVGEDLHRLMGGLYEELAVAAPARIAHDSASYPTSSCASSAEGGLVDPAALSLPLKRFLQQGHRELCLLRIFQASRGETPAGPSRGAAPSSPSGVHTAEILHAFENLAALVRDLDETSAALAVASTKREESVRSNSQPRSSSVSPLREAGRDDSKGRRSVSPLSLSPRLSASHAPERRLTAEVAVSALANGATGELERVAAPRGFSPVGLPPGAAPEDRALPVSDRLSALKNRFLSTVEQLLLLLLLPLPAWHPLGSELAVWGGSLAIEIATAMGLSAAAQPDRGERGLKSQLVSAAQSLCLHLETIPQRETLEHLAMCNPFYLQQFRDSEDEAEGDDAKVDGDARRPLRRAREDSKQGGNENAPDASAVLVEDLAVVYRLLGEAGKRIAMWDFFCAFCRETLGARLAHEKALLKRREGGVEAAAERVEEGDDGEGAHKRRQSRQKRKDKKLQERQFELDVLQLMEAEGQTAAQQVASAPSRSTGTCRSSARASSSPYASSVPPANLLQQLQLRFAVALGTLDHQLGLLRLPSAGAVAAAAEQMLVEGAPREQAGLLFSAHDGDGDEELDDLREDAEGHELDQARRGSTEGAGGAGEQKRNTRSSGKRGLSRLARGGGKAAGDEEEDSDEEVGKEIEEELIQMRELLHGVYAHRTQFGTVYVHGNDRERRDEEEEQEEKEVKVERRSRRKTRERKKKAKRDDYDY
ncbi:hypothetical protein BESB_059710 [Besnoitia besnoiti]|uniref:Uncharacterized protein n=1 Tax=Besnoitia besnoiti TaxID=94643 RepID=A0A2A9MCZ3_BESBE|nr:hypothetical protein BESB_059710 [Besnoitia besnoiti]PFH35084.1 hypothetical protein BESB_059710 [Besnoitia besnoiti]